MQKLPTLRPCPFAVKSCVNLLTPLVSRKNTPTHFRAFYTTRTIDQMPRETLPPFTFFSFLKLVKIKFTLRSTSKVPFCLCVRMRGASGSCLAHLTDLPQHVAWWGLICLEHEMKSVLKRNNGARERNEFGLTIAGYVLMQPHKKY